MSLGKTEKLIVGAVSLANQLFYDHFVSVNFVPFDGDFLGAYESYRRPKTS